MKPPAFQFYADDFLAGTMDLSAEEVGAYIRLLCHQWNRGGLTTVKPRLNRIAGTVVTAEVLEKFTQGEDGLLRNERLEDERRKQEEFRAMQSAKGRKSAEARRRKQPDGNRGSTVVENRLQPNGNSPSPSPSPILEEREQGRIASGDVPRVEEVIAFGDRSGVGPDVCRKFFEHYEGNNLWLNQHGRLINWRVKLPGWGARERQGEEVMGGQGERKAGANAQQGGVSASMVMMRDMEALKRVEARRKEIRECYDAHMDWSREHRQEFKSLGVELKNLKGRLEMAA